MTSNQITPRLFLENDGQRKFLLKTFGVIYFPPVFRNLRTTGVPNKFCKLPPVRFLGGSI